MTMYKDSKKVTNKTNLENAISEMASFLRNLSQDTQEKKQALKQMFLNIEAKKNKTHTPNHSKCNGFKVSHTGTTKEKRMCHCMFYYMQNNLKKCCDKCKIEQKWKNVGIIQVTEFEIPTTNVYTGVGGMDLIFDNKYAVEVKPPKSEETLARMFAEILTYTSDFAEEKYKPAICLFKNSVQMNQFDELRSNPKTKDDLDVITQAVKVFYFETSSLEEQLVEYSIHPIDELL